MIFTPVWYCCVLQTKCESYIPDRYAKFGDIEVSLTGVVERSGYTLRNISLKVSAALSLLVYAGHVQVSSSLARVTQDKCNNVISKRDRWKNGLEKTLCNF